VITRHGIYVAGICVGLLLGMLPTDAWGQNSTPDVSSLSLETLASTEITSVSRKEQKLTEAASAIFVITSEDIRRSGLSNIAELLRTVPGLDVAEIDANKWSITSRGFGERYPDKMLVLLDGRTLYSPLTSGVSWDVQETMLEDVERIEVIRGPGATLWGANAVNGVVNIITKKANDTQGVLGVGRVTLQDRDSGAVRYGGTIGSRGYYRIFGKYFDRDGSVQPGSGGGADGWHDLRSGFRADWDLAQGTTLTVHGDIYRGRVGTTVPGIISLSPPLSGDFIDKTINTGGNLIGRWSRASAALETTIQGYVDVVNRNEIGVLGQSYHTFDLDFVQRYHPGTRHDLLWGSDFRDNADRTVGSLNISFDPASRSTQLYGVFAQDEITLVPAQLKLTLGSKLEHNYYSGFALQPNGRLIWIPGDRSSTWIAISRASESSSRTDADIRTNENPEIDANGILTISSSFGMPHLPPENVLAYELGSRLQMTRKFALDAATFYNEYTNRHTDEPGTPYFEDSPMPRHLVLPTYTASNIHGETHGLEFLAQSHPTANWELTGSYTLFEIHLHQSALSQDFDTAPGSEGSTPRQKFQIHSLVTLPHNFEFDTSLYRVGQLGDPAVPAYSRVDLRAGWRPNPSLELSAGGRNLLQAEHTEFPSGDLVKSEPIARSAYLKATWSF
jgi:iron complex outermembrane recepter protein